MAWFWQKQGEEEDQQHHHQTRVQWAYNKRSNKNQRAPERSTIITKPSTSPTYFTRRKEQVCACVRPSYPPSLPLLLLPSF